jgi:phospholipase/carboxylesterase
VSEVGEPPLAHLVREPAGEAGGALVLMHGRGVDETDLYPLLDELDPERRLLGITPGGPITDLPPGGRHWYVVERVGFPERQGFEASRSGLARLLDDLLGARSIGWGRTVLGGFSQGAVMAYALALSPDRPPPAGVLALSGFLPTVEGWEPDLAGRQGLPVYITHGSLDPMIPVELGRRARERLERSGLDVSYRESPIPHTIDPRLLPEMRGWVAAHTGDVAASRA